MEELAAPWGACLPDKQLLDGRLCQGAAFLVLLCQVFIQKAQLWSVLHTASAFLNWECALEVGGTVLRNSRFES